jgi:helix-turn-helix protein
MKAQRSIGTTHVLIIDYLQVSSISADSYASSVALLGGNEVVVNTLKAYLQPMCGTPPRAQSLSDIDKKLLYMLYTGINDMLKLSFLIGTDAETLAGSFKNLRDQGLCDTMGKLTQEGMTRIKELM